MQFEKCLTCPSIKGKQCAGPNFMTAPTKENVEWIIAYQKLNGITNAQLAERSGIPKGTIDGLKHRADVRHDTLFPLIKALIEMTGGVWGGESCPAVVSNSAERQQEILKLTQELNHANDLLGRSARVLKALTISASGFFVLCVGLIVLLLVISL